jgi:hypothetical protein
MQSYKFNLILQKRMLKVAPALVLHLLLKTKFRHDLPLKQSTYDTNSD